MSMDIPMSGRVPGIVGEVGNARQLPGRTAGSRTKKRPPRESSEEFEAFDSLELPADGGESDAGDEDGSTIIDCDEIETSDDDEPGELSLAIADDRTSVDSAESDAADDEPDDLSLASTNGLTLTDVKASYDSN